MIALPVMRPIPPPRREPPIHYKSIHKKGYIVERDNTLTFYKFTNVLSDLDKRPSELVIAWEAFVAQNNEV